MTAGIEAVPLDLFTPRANYEHVSNGLFSSTFEKLGMAKPPPDILRVRDGDLIIEARLEESCGVSAKYKIKTPWIDCVLLVLCWPVNPNGNIQHDDK